MSKIFIKVIRFYQLFISPLLPKSCRYYPTCSEYCALCLRYDGFCRAIFSGTRRILRCNQFFCGGVDHPIVEIKFENTGILSKTNLNFVSKFTPKVWFIPHKNGGYFVVKTIKGK